MVKLSLNLPLRVLRATSVIALSITLISKTPPSAIAEDRIQIEQRSSISSALKRIGSILKSGLSKIPSAAEAAASKRQRPSKSNINDLPTDSSVSGTPPTLSEIANSPIENIFWRPDVVTSIGNSSASPLQCSEFYLGTSDSLSGGLRICELSEGIGFSLQTLLSAQRTLCYIKSLPNKKSLKTGAVSILTGAKKIPDGDFSKIFAPGTKARTIRINTPVIDQINLTAQNIFVKVHSAVQNARSNRLYDAEIFSCQEGESEIRSTTRVTINETGQISIRTANIATPLSNGSMTTLIKGYLRPVGSGLAWDLSRKRTIEINALQSDTENFKSSIVITPENYLSIKRRNLYQATVNQEYSTSIFSGDSALSFLFLEGALQAAFITGGETSSYSGASEYRDTFYAAAPTNALLEKVREYDLDGDQFFQSDPTIDSPPSTYSCGISADIVLALDETSQSLKDSLGPCASEVLEGMDFCSRSSAVSAALQNFTNACSQ